MKNHLRKFVIIVMLFAVAGNVSAQPWMKALKNNSNPTFREIQKSFYDYWNAKGVDMTKVKDADIGEQSEKGDMSSYVQFKRWEWINSRRLMPDGSFPDPMIAYKEAKKFQNTSNKRTKNISSITASWSSMGPGTVPTGGGSGRLNTIAFNPLNPTTMYVGAPGGGFWKSYNGGTTWNPTTTDLLATLGITDIVVDPIDTNIIYISTGDADGRDTYSNGVMKSLDGGATWNTTGLSLSISSRTYICKLIINPTNSSILIAATKDGVMRTTDGGATWTTTMAGTRVWDVKFKPNNPNVVYASTDSCIFRSTNGGLNFTNIATYTNVDRIELAVTPIDTNYVYALFSNNTDDSFYGLYRSTDGGGTYTQMSSSPNIFGWTTNGSDAGGQGWYDNSIAASTTTSGTIFIGGVNIWKSTNGGTTWTNVTDWSTATNQTNYVHADIHRLMYLPGSGSTIYAACDGGIHKSTNSGAAWTNISSGLTIMEMYSASSAQTVNNIISCGAQDNGTNKYNAGAWSQTHGGDGMITAVDYTNANTMYCTTYNGALYRSTNGGSTWSSRAPTGQSGSGAWVTPYIIDPNNHLKLYAGYADLWRSTNQGSNWTQISNTPTGVATDLVMAVAAAKSDSNYIYAAWGNNYTWRNTPAHLFKTTNGGTTWTEVTGSLVLDSLVAITSICIKPTDANTVWVTIGGFNAAKKVYKTTDGGLTWTNVTANLPNTPINCMVYVPNTTDAVYIGTDIGVFYTDPSQFGSWVAFNDGLPNVCVYDLNIQVTASLLRAGTFGRGLWSTPLYITTDVKNASNDNCCTKIYPNPTNGIVMIEMNTNEPTTITVFNAMGEKITDVKVENIAGSQYKMDLSSKARGIYFIKMDNGKTVTTEKVVLMN